MTKIKLKEKALKLRKTGMSYSQIKKKLGVSKSTLSMWLRDLPLSEERIKELRDNNPRRIERYRNTMRKKREGRQRLVYENIAIEIGSLSERELFLAGLFLYWGEGGKTQKSEISMSNTDPAVLKFFIKWISLLKVQKDKIRIVLQLYSDMDEKEEKEFWKQELNLNDENFRKCYIKKSKTLDISYKRKFTHGTCNLRIGGRDLEDRVFMGIRRLREISGS